MRREYEDAEAKKKGKEREKLQTRSETRRQAEVPGSIEEGFSNAFMEVQMSSGNRT